MSGAGPAYDDAGRIALRCGYATGTVVNVLRALRAEVEYQARRGGTVTIEGMGKFKGNPEKGRHITVPHGAGERRSMTLPNRKKLAFIPKKAAKYL